MSHEVEERREPEPERPEIGLVTQRNAGLMALGAMSEEEFDRTANTVKLGLARLDRIINDVLEPGVDYDEPPYLQREGEKRKKNLLLAGAEKLAFMLRLVPAYGVTRTAGSGDRDAAVHYGVQCLLHLGSLDGPVVATGVGSANTHETKYRYRYAEKMCPACHKAGTIRRSKFADKISGERGWYCRDCNAQFAAGDHGIEQQAGGMVENPDPLDLDNTVLKMAKTRSLRDAIKGATAGSGRLTQDLEDEAFDEESKAKPAPAPRKPRTRPNAAQRPAAVSAEMERVDLISKLWDSARRAGMKKVGEVLAEVGIGLGMETVPSKLADLSDEQMRAAVEHMEALAGMAAETEPVKPGQPPAAPAVP